MCGTGEALLPTVLQVTLFPVKSFNLIVHAYDFHSSDTMPLYKDMVVFLVPGRFKRFDNKFIRPYLLRDYKGQEPKILETFSKLTMKDAMELMKRNASNVGNISGTESMSAIFRNYTSNNLNLNGRCVYHSILSCLVTATYVRCALAV